MSGKQVTEIVAELVCDRDGTTVGGYDQTPDSLRDTMANLGWASDVQTTECQRPYGDLCPGCCEQVEVDGVMVL